MTIKPLIIASSDIGRRLKKIWVFIKHLRNKGVVNQKMMPPQTPPPGFD